MDDTLVLCYHGLSARWPSTLAVDPARFEEQLDGLLRRGYRGVTLDQAVFGSRGPKSLAVTFDDGFRSVITEGFPILQRLGFPATVFVCTDWVDSEEPMRWAGIEQWAGTHPEELISLSTQELGSLIDAGWEVGSHTRSHPRLPEIEDTELAVELAGSRAECERRLGIACRSLAYPYGDRDERVISAAADAGYEIAVTMDVELASPLRWPRVGVFPRDTPARFRLKVSPWIRRLRVRGMPTALPARRHG